MATTPWHRRFLATTRGRLVALLRRDTHTVEELARALDLTDNAVRAHLAALERDGLVRQSGVRRGGGSGKPAYAYTLAPDGESLFPKAYALILREVLDVVVERSAPTEVVALLREAGRRIAAERGAARGDAQARLNTAVAVLNDLGGAASLETNTGATEIRCAICPLAAIVPSHPEVCHLAETLLGEIAGQPVHERCERGEQPHCRFEITAV